MLKIPENKTRKRFRIAQCIFYAILVMLCSMPYIQGATTDGKFFSYSVLDLMSFIVGFFFCLFDRERNIKNIVSLLCCAAGIVAILAIAGVAMSLGAILSILIYLLISFLTTIAIFARFTKDSSDDNKKQNIRK